MFKEGDPIPGTFIMRVTSRKSAAGNLARLIGQYEADDGPYCVGVYVNEMVLDNTLVEVRKGIVKKKQDLVKESREQYKVPEEDPRLWEYIELDGAEIFPIGIGCTEFYLGRKYTNGKFEITTLTTMEERFPGFPFVRTRVLVEGPRGKNFLYSIYKESILNEYRLVD